jgi:tetratricopeptide (TPR) repeat protein
VVLRPRFNLTVDVSGANPSDARPPRPELVPAASALLERPRVTRSGAISPMSRLSELVSDLRRRGVHRAAALYLAGAWLVIEVSDTIFPRLGLPDGAVTALVWVAMVGLPVALSLAWSFDLTRHGFRRHRSASPVRRVSAWWSLALVVVLAAAATGSWLVRGRAGPAGGPAVPAGLDAAVVAVLPFRVAGADTRLAYLREGLVDLMSTKLTGEVGPRAVDPGTVMSAWRRLAGSVEGDLPEDSALAVARAAGAGRALLGSVVGTPEALVLNVTVLATVGRGVRTTAAVSGPADSLVALVDRAVATVLSLESGREGSQLAALTGTSLPALRSYLSGEASYRRGEYETAIEQFDDALIEDPTFAMAGLGLYRAAGWVGGAVAAGDRGLAAAWQHQSRLSPRDRAYLIARVGPVPGRTSTRELLAAREDALALMPDRAEMWYELADFHFHYGWLLGDRSALRRALDGFRQALVLDPEFAGPRQHAIAAAAVVGDTAYLRELAAWHPHQDSTSEAALYARWRVAMAHGDTLSLARLRAGMAGWGAATLRHVGVDVQDSGLPAAEGARAVALRAERGGTAAERRERMMGLHAFALNRGRPAEAAGILAGFDPPRDDPGLALRQQVLDALYAHGDASAAALAAAALESLHRGAGRRPDGRPDGPSAGARVAGGAALDRCVLAQWRLAAGRELEPGTLAALRAFAPDGWPWTEVVPACVRLVEALAAPAGTPARRAGLERLESLMLEAPYRSVIDLYDPYVANLALARLWEEAGEPDRALDAARRRIYFHGWNPHTAAFILTEARLAERVGRRDEAIDAYRRFLRLRDDPEPTLAAQVESARAALAALLEMP